MRVSVDPNDRAFVAADRHAQREVKLNGELAHHVITADDELGLIVCYPVDERNMPLLTKDGKSFKTITKFGKVEIGPVDGGK
jgi:hypothetical protein